MTRQPNGKVPALQDGDLNIFESGAILLYLVNKYDKSHKLWRYHPSHLTNNVFLLPHYLENRILEVHANYYVSADPVVQAEIMCWLFLQVTSLGPNVWQYLNWETREEMQSARPVFRSEIIRILHLLEDRLSRPGSNGWISDHGMSIADIAWAPLVDGWKQKRCNVDLRKEGLKEVEKWSDRIYARPAVKKAYDVCGLFFGERPGYP